MILGKFLDKPESNINGFSFRKMFFIGQNLKQVHVKCSFLELLIFFSLTLVQIFSIVWSLFLTTSKKYYM